MLWSAFLFWEPLTQSLGIIPLVLLSLMFEVQAVPIQEARQHLLRPKLAVVLVPAQQNVSRNVQGIFRDYLVGAVLVCFPL